MKDNNFTDILREAYRWGRNNGKNKSEKNFNDFLEKINKYKKMTNEEIGVNISKKLLEKLKE